MISDVGTGFEAAARELALRRDRVGVRATLAIARAPALDDRVDLAQTLVDYERRREIAALLDEHARLDRDLDALVVHHRASRVRLGMDRL